MSLTFGLPAVLDLGIATACIRAAFLETGNRPVMLWKFGIAPLLGAVVAITLLAATPSDRMPEAAWVGAAAAVCILAVTMVDSLTTLPGYPAVPERYDPAIGGALFAGFLVGRVRTMAARRSDLRTSSCTTFSSRRPRL